VQASSCERSETTPRTHFLLFANDNCFPYRHSVGQRLAFHIIHLIGTKVLYFLSYIWDNGKNRLTMINLFKKRDNSLRYLECRQRNDSDVWIHHVACKFRGFFHQAPTLYRYLETIIDFKWQKRGSLNSSRPLTWDEAYTDLFENLSVNSSKGDLSNVTTSKPPLFSLVNTFK
jgi:hypothetical protein